MDTIPASLIAQLRELRSQLSHAVSLALASESALPALASLVSAHGYAADALRRLEATEPSAAPDRFDDEPLPLASPLRSEGPVTLVALTESAAATLGAASSEASQQPACRVCGGETRKLPGYGLTWCASCFRTAVVSEDDA